MAGGLTFCGITNYLLVTFTNWQYQVELAEKRTRDDREKECKKKKHNKNEKKFSTSKFNFFYFFSSALLAHYSNKSYNDEIQDIIIPKKKEILSKIIFISFCLILFIAGLIYRYIYDGFDFSDYKKLNDTINLYNSSWTTQLTSLSSASSDLIEK